MHWQNVLPYLNLKRPLQMLVAMQSSWLARLPQLALRLVCLPQLAHRLFRRLVHQIIPQLTQRLFRRLVRRMIHRIAHRLFRR